MYIIVFEDGEVSKAKNITDDDREGCDNGILEIIDISNPDDPKSYYQGQWHEVQEWSA